MAAKTFVMIKNRALCEGALDSAVGLTRQVTGGGRCCLQACPGASAAVPLGVAELTGAEGWWWWWWLGVLSYGWGAISQRSGTAGHHWGCWNEQICSF